MSRLSFNPFRRGNVSGALIRVGLALAVLIPAGGFAQNAVAPANGDGTSGNPYPITELGNLVWLGDQAAANATEGKYYKMMNDIDASATANWNDRGSGTSVLEGFSPIGVSYSYAFEGVFQGQGYKISGLVINRSSASYVGLFGYLGPGGEVKNLGLADGAVTGQDYIGGLAGYNLGMVSACYASAAATGEFYVGGLAGGNAGTISACYATGAVRGSAFFVGGLVGENESMISECYSAGKVTGSGFGIGGLVGESDGGTVSDSYWDTVTSGRSSSAGGTGKTTAEMQQQTTFADWDFTTLWGIQGSYPYLSATTTYTLVYTAGKHGVISNGARTGATLTQTVKAGSTGVAVTAVADAGYRFAHWSDERTDNPRVDANVTANALVSATFSDVHTVAPVAGDGSESSPFQITELGNLVWLYDQADAGATAGAYFKLMNDLDASATATWNDSGTDTSVNEGFRPIGTGNHPFLGVIDGAGHRITGLVINRSSARNVGLFGYIGLVGEVKNLGLVAGSVNGYSYVGGLVGYNDGGTISQCDVTGAVTGINSDIGGLVGRNDNGAIFQCYATGAETEGTWWVGGLAGYNTGGKISQCNATRKVTGKAHVGAVQVGENWSGAGGLVGYNSGTISACYATGAVTGDNKVGGLVGSGGNLSQCYATGAVTGNDSVGGLVGSGGNLSQCYATGAVMGNNSVGGLAGSIFDAISQCFAAGAVAGGGNYVGGLVGSNSGRTITECYATGSVTGDAEVGGLTGENAGTITHCYAIGTVGGSREVGGLVGYDKGGTVSASYWDTATSGRSQSAGGTGKTTTEMMQQATFVGWDFSVWGIENSYPYFRVHVTPSSGDGSKAYPYQITRLDHLVWLQGQAAMMTISGNSYRLVNDIDASITAGWPKGFKPIASSYRYSFDGVFDGAGHTIAGLVINRPLEEYVGLFGHIGKDGEVKNLGLIDGVVAVGSYYVGSLAGENEGTILACHTTGVVTGENDDAGGLVGRNSSGTIKRCYATGAVRGDSGVGGLAGYNDGGAILACYATGTVAGSGNDVGGLVGNSEGDILQSSATGRVTGVGNFVGGLVGSGSGAISACFASGEVRGSDSVGGLVGSALDSTISRCHADGDVTGSGDFVGGLVGSNGGDTISGCYATGAITGSGEAVGGLVGDNYGAISQCRSTGPVTGGSWWVGGLVGRNNYDESTVSECYATGEVSGTGSNCVVGGLVGYNYKGRIARCYAAGNVTARDIAIVGGLLGWNDAGTISNSYWDTSTSGQSSSDGGTGKSTAEMKQQATYVGWDFAAVWGIADSYPYLRCLDATHVIQHRIQDYLLERSLEPNPSELDRNADGILDVADIVTGDARQSP